MATLSSANFVSVDRATCAAPRLSSLGFLSSQAGRKLSSPLNAGHLSLQGTKKLRPVCAVVKEVDLSKVVPQADRILVKLEEISEKSVGGVLLPKSAVKFENYLLGEVVSVGKEVASVNAGQKVLFSDINAYEVNLGTEERVCFVKAADLLAFVE